MNSYLKKALSGLAVFGFVFLLSALLNASPLLEQMNTKLVNGLYGERGHSDEIVIVGIDEPSLKSISEGGLGFLDSWDRTFISETLEAVREGGSHSIFLDLIFFNPVQNVHFTDLNEIASSVTSDSEFVEDLLTYLGDVHPQDQALADSLGEDVFLLEYTNSSSLDIFTSQAREGFAQSNPEGNDQVIRSLPLLYEGEETLALKMVRDYLYGAGSEQGYFEGEVYVFDGNRSIPSVVNDQYLINYAGETLSFPVVSFVDVYKGRVDPSVFDGKMVLIGATAPILQDNHLTPIDPEVPMPGVEIQANAIQTILDGAFLKEQGSAGFLVFVGFVVAVSIFVYIGLPVWVGALLLAAELVAFPFYAQWMFNQGVIVNMVWPVFAMVLTYLTSLAYRYVTEFKEKRKIQSAFGHYVSPALVKEIAKNPELLKLGGERRNISILFLDFENFTALSESLKPQKVVELVNTYFGALAEVIMEHGGTVDKFEGDAIMALFGAPVPSEDHALKACESALALMQKMEELAQTTGSGLKLRIGIASGESIVGNMGSVKRFDYTAMGDTVNIASRLESGNKFYGTRVLVNAEAMNAGQSTLSFRRVDRVRFKGKKEAVDIYEVLGWKSEMSPEGAEVLNEWHQALEYYRNGAWNEAETRLQAMLTKMPGDKAAEAYLKRIEVLKMNPPAGWDGVWTFEVK